MESHEARIRENLTRQLRAWELLEGELSARLDDDPDFQEALEAFSKDGTRRELLTKLVKADPGNTYLRSFNEPLGSADYEKLSQELDRVFDRLAADADLADAVKVARQGADAVVLGEDLVVIVNLVQNLALIAMPVALVLAARVKRIGDTEFFKGVPKEVVDIVIGLKGLVGGGK